jgi:hypothetical protein
MNPYTLHLTVLQSITEDRDPTQVGAICNPQRTEVAWNDSFTAFRLIALKWWDDASYIAYQSGIDGEDDDRYEGDLQGDEPAAVVAAVAPAAPPIDSDEIPF